MPFFLIFFFLPPPPPPHPHVQINALNATFANTTTYSSLFVLSCTGFAKLTRSSRVYAHQAQVLASQGFRIDTTSVLDASGAVLEGGMGEGAFAEDIATGATHGGAGGGTQGPAYGSAFLPAESGSAGASSSDESGGAGGGVLSVYTKQLVIKGEIRADGKAGDLVYVNQK